MGWKEEERGARVEENKGERRFRSQRKSSDREAAKRERKKISFSTRLLPSVWLFSPIVSAPGSPLVRRASVRTRKRKLPHRFSAAAAPLFFFSISVRSLFARSRRLVECDVEKEEGGSACQPRGRGPHGAREHRVRAPGVELLVVDHRRGERERKSIFFFFESFEDGVNIFLAHCSRKQKGQKKSTGKSKGKLLSFPSSLISLSRSAFSSRLLVTMTGADAPTTSGAAPSTAASANSGAKSHLTFKGAARLVLAAKRFQGASLLSMISLFP